MLLPYPMAAESVSCRAGGVAGCTLPV